MGRGQDDPLISAQVSQAANPGALEQLAQLGNRSEEHREDCACPEHKERRTWTNCCQQRMGVTRTFPSSGRLIRLFGSRVGNHHVLQRLAQPLPSMGSSWCCPMGHYPPEHSRPCQTQTQHSIHVIFLGFFSRTNVLSLFLKWEESKN